MVKNNIVKMLIGLASLLPFSLFAQLTVTNTQTPQQLVQNVLLGSGVTASNFSFTGDATQIGFFQGTGTGLGIDSGIVMTSGDVTMVPGGAGTLTSMAFNSTVGDPDLATILAASPIPVQGVNDVAILEFDFVPQGDTVKFDYVFASEEYPDFVCDFNDIFGLFISGPGIAGPYTNGAENIALVPGTGQAVSITTINNGDSNGACAWAPQNNQFYIDNSTSTTVTFDAFTTVLTAQSPVTCGQTYHVKMAVADAGDWSYDSGIFLKANSFSSESIILSADIDLGGNDSTLFEGCGIATISIQRAGNINVDDTLHFIIGGTAGNGDYVPFPDSVLFFPGQSVATISIQTLQDNLTEPMETITITTISGPCNSIVSTITIYISDVPQVIANAGNDTTLQCPGDPAFLHATGSGGVPGLSFEWNNGLGIGRTKTVNPLVTTLYTVTVRDTCNQVFDIDTMIVNIPVAMPLQAIGCPDRYSLCPGQQVDIFATAVGGIPPYTYTWQSPPVNGSAFTVSPQQDTAYVVLVEDVCQQMYSYDTVRVFVIPFDSMVVELQEQLVCPGDTATLITGLHGGVEPYSFFWPHSGETSQSVQVQTTTDNIYQVEVTDFCGNTRAASGWVKVNNAIADFDWSPDPEGYYRITFHDKSLKPVWWFWDMADNSIPYLTPSFSHEFPDSGFYPVTLISRNESGCYDTITKRVTVEPEFFLYIPSAFTPNGDQQNDQLHIGHEGLQGFSIRIFNRWGQPIWQNESDFSKIHWDGNDSDGKPVPQGTYVYLFNGNGLNGKPFKQKGTITLIR